MSDHPHTPNTADTADLVRRLIDTATRCSAYSVDRRNVLDAINEIERLSAIVAAVDAHISAPLRSPIHNAFNTGYAYACSDLLAIIHPEENR